MSNTYKRVSESLSALLNDRDHKVVALRGKWGTGKTHLWTTMASSVLVGGKPPIYVSLFGVRTIKELKLRILQNISSSEQTAFAKFAETSGGFLAGLMKRYTGYSAEDALVLWLSSFVKDRLIVIDDLERKHSSLGTDEVMGFLNEYSESHGAKFLVLLNLEKLEDELWNTLHEKVVDGEVVLEPSPDEAFDIAANGKSDEYISYVRSACEKLKITNIRIIRKILRVVNKVATLISPPHNSYGRWVGSVVLLVSLHYRAVEHAPPFDYIKTFNTFERGFLDVVEGEEGEQQKEWSRLLEELGIHSIDEFEYIIQDYLKSGLMKEQELQRVLARYQAEYEQGDFYSRRRELFTAYWWDPTLSEADLKVLGKQVVDQAGMLSPSEISELVGVFERFGDVDLAQEALDKWASSLPGRCEYQNLTATDQINDFDQLRPGVKAALQTMLPALSSKLTLAEAMANIVYGRWGSRETQAVESATLKDYISTIRSLKHMELKNFLEEHVKWHGAQLGNEYFPNGVKNFVQACRAICLTEPTGRLTGMIRRVFAARKKEALL
jgi:hypothetical protein